jgi:hypothetical protein
MNTYINQSISLSPGNYNLSFYNSFKPETVTTYNAYISNIRAGTQLTGSNNAMTIVINPLTTTLQGGSQSTA